MKWSATTPVVRSTVWSVKAMPWSLTEAEVGVKLVMVDLLAGMVWPPCYSRGL